MKKQLILAAAACIVLGASASVPAPSTLLKDPAVLTPHSGRFAPRMEDAVNDDTDPSDDADAPEENSIVFGYCQDLANAIGFQQVGAVMRAAIQIPAQTAKQWKGAKITKIRIGYGEANVRNVTVFVAKTVLSNPLYSQTATIAKLNAWNEIEFTTPYEIDGSAFFVGYEVTTRAVTDYPIGVDMVYPDNNYGDYITLNGQWAHFGEQVGNVCVQIVVTGDNLPQNDVSLTGIALPDFVQPNAEFEIEASIKNNGVKTVNELTASVKVGNESYDDISVTLPAEGVKPGDFAVVTIPGLKCATEGTAIPVSVSLDNVNGVANENTSSNSASELLVCLDKGFKRNVVMEEWTGTWCGWCPYGIVGMNYMSENYGDDGFIGIAVHDGDAMQVSSYDGFINYFNAAGSYPGGIMDRTHSITPDKATLETYFKYQRQIPSTANVTLKATFSDDEPTIIKIDTETEFSLTESGASYTLAFVITENNVGPYSQTNYYAGGSSGNMDGWEKLGSKVSTYYNEVARDIFNWNGFSGSLPTTIEKGEIYNFSTEISTANVFSINDCHVVAMVINTKTNRIENAAQVSMAGSSSTIDAVSDNAEIYAVDGGILVCGNVDSFSVYSVDGKAVASSAGLSKVNVNPGLYIVNALTLDGKTLSRKVLVK